MTKSTLVLIKLYFNNPSLGKSSKSSTFIKKKKPCVNKKNIIHRKVESKNALKSQPISINDFRFLENKIKDKKSMSPIVARSTIRNHDTLFRTTILKRPSTISTSIASIHSSEKTQKLNYVYVSPSSDFDYCSRKFSSLKLSLVAHSPWKFPSSRFIATSEGEIYKNGPSSNSKFYVSSPRKGKNVKTSNKKLLMKPTPIY